MKSKDNLPLKYAVIIWLVTAFTMFAVIMFIIGALPFYLYAIGLSLCLFLYKTAKRVILITKKHLKNEKKSV